ncbi:hypothetical protein KFK09_019895 [Dendrobium nobile]|uniref:Retrovirus-related Pol polyprotein from transposon TNT 1-94 n=1 Tax=Dendrobium nobile TaxID=94219 RepID=A0A8T3AXX7_DENNO|nr:hypothetical protein KFK09_019895 [Dendrobium nobile]
MALHPFFHHLLLLLQRTKLVKMAAKNQIPNIKNGFELIKTWLPLSAPPYLRRSSHTSSILFPHRKYGIRLKGGYDLRIDQELYSSKNELHNIQMKSLNMTQYLQQIKTIVDNISFAGATIDQEDVLLYTMNGLPPSYNALKTTIRAMQSPMDLDTLYSLLIIEEINLQSQSLRQLTITDASTALYSNRGRGRRGRTRPNTQNARPSNPNAPQCQICGKRGHLAHNCWHRLNITVSPPETTASNNSARAMVAANDTENPDWYLDSGASTHLTNSVDNLSQAQSYTGTDAITIGDGRSLPVAHSGNGILSTPYRKIHLKNLLHVPHLFHNLISISKLTQDNNISVNFNPSSFDIKDMKTNRVLLSGPNHKGLYPVHSASKIESRTTSLATRVNKELLWHQRLGHPHERIIAAVSAQDKSLHIPNNMHFCSDCTTSKGHRLPFSNKPHRASMPIAIIHTDVWGPAPVHSNQGFMYYVVFIDDFSRFSWVFFMHHKSEVFNIFRNFKTFIEKQTQHQIKCLRSDGGTEYLNHNFKNFLNQQGISHQTSCPYTPEQNGLAERKHRHLIETARTLINKASIPHAFWPDAILMASFLINRLPTITTNWKSPLSIMFNKKPDYKFLKVFGCACYPWIPSNQRTKLQPRSRSCVFLGYSHMSKGYKCLDISTGKIHISRHVVFDEITFPFQQTPTTTPRNTTSPPASLLVPVSTTIDTHTNNTKITNTNSIGVPSHYTARQSISPSQQLPELIPSNDISNSPAPT